MTHKLIAIALMLCLIPHTADARREGTLRFAQLTDVHLCDRTPSHTDDLMRSIERINALDSLDFVIVTGDVTEDGDRTTIQLVKKCLASLRVPYYSVMGNHETKWSESGCTAWKDIFDGERFQTKCKGVNFLGFNTGPLMRMAYGHVTAQDLLWLQEKLDSIPQDEPTIIVTHYPLLPVDMDNWYEATDLLRRYNVRLCIGGHFHRANNFSYDGIPGVLMPSCCHDAEHATTFGLYEVRDDSIIARVCEDGKEPYVLASYAMNGDIKDKDGNVLRPDGRAGQYPDSADNARFADVRRVWMRKSRASIYSSPSADSKRVYVGDDTGALTAYSLRDGEPQWTFRTGARIVGTPAVSKGIVVTGSADKCIYGLSARNGRLLWKVQTHEPVLGAVRIVDGVAYVGGSDHCIRAIDIRDGKAVWTYNGVGGYIETMPLVTDESVIFGAWDGKLYCLSRKDGTEMWTWDTGMDNTHYSPAAVWPVEAHGRVFIADPSRTLTAIDAGTGKTVWSTKQSVVRESLGISEDKNRIYGKTMRDSIVCYSTQANMPHELWACHALPGYDHAPSMPQERDGIVYGGTVTGIIYAIAAADGQLLWRHRIGGSLVNTVVPVGKGRVLFTSSDGGIGILEGPTPR